MPHASFYQNRNGALTQSRLLAAFFGSAILCGSEVFAQASLTPDREPVVSPNSEQNGEPIVVTGRRHRADPAEDFVGALALEAENDQLAAFEAPICPISMGLSPDFNVVVSRRIREIAVRTGVEVADLDCRPNLAVIIVDDGEDLISRLSDTSPMMFGDLDSAIIERLANGPGPVRAWHAIQTRGSDGRLMKRVVIGGREVDMLDGVVPSRIARSTRQDVALAFVLIDAAAIDGLSLGQIGDYAAMRALAKTDPARAAEAGQPTILTLFDDRDAGRTPPDALTEWDEIFVRSLYATDRTRSAHAQRSAMIRHVREELDEPEQ